MSASSSNMDDSNSLSQNIETTLKTLFPNINLILEKVNYGGSISVFIIDIPTERVLDKSWSEISSAIAANYQAFLENDFERWNIYIIYKCREKINLSLGYRIENDKFSSRKIVHTIETEEDNDLLNNTLVTKYITHKDLELRSGNDLHIQVKYVSESKIWKFVSNGKIKPFRNSSKEVNIVLEQIEIELENEN